MGGSARSATVHGLASVAASDSAGLDGGAARSLVMAAIVAALTERAVLIELQGRHERLTLRDHMQRAIRQTFGEAHPATVLCRSQMTSGELAAAIPQERGAVLVFVNVHVLPRQLQAQVADILRSQTIKTVAGNMSLAGTAVLCTGQAESLCHELRESIFMQLSFDPGPETLAVERSGSVLMLQREVSSLREQLPGIHVSAEVFQYIQDIVVFVRTHRFVRGGVSPRAVRDIEQLVRFVSLMEGRTYATPSAVNVAVRHIMPLRITLCKSEDEPSLQYGGDIEIGRRWLAQWDPAALVDTVLATVPSPL